MRSSSLRAPALASLFTILAAVSMNASAQYTDQGSSSINVSTNADGQTVYTTVTTSFDIAHLWEGENSAPMLLKKVKTEVQVEGLDGSDGHVVVEARKSAQGTFDSLLYRIDEDAHDAAAADNNLLLTWKFGCCDSATTYHAFNIRTGKLLMSYDDRTGTAPDRGQSPFFIEVPNSGLSRYIGILTGSATRDFVSGETADHMEKVATLTYTDLSGNKKQYDIFAKIPSGWGIGIETTLVDLSGSNEISRNQITLWSSDQMTDPARAFNGFGIKIHVYLEQETEFVLPVKNDKIDLQGVQIPNGFRVIPVN